jgi:hypothetical protein
MRNESAQGSAVVPAVLQRSTPRHVKLNAGGLTTVITVAAVAAGCLWAAFAIERRSTTTSRHARLFAVEAVAADAEVVRVQRRGDEGRRVTVHYRYIVGNRAYSGSRNLRRGADAPATGSRIAVRYLASEPTASWIDGSRPEHQPAWPPFVIVGAAAVTMACPLFFLRRQWHLLTYGRPAMAVITKIEKKRSDKASYWRVHYEWTLLSGARRTGHYAHSNKVPPEVGSSIAILYDRDRPSRHSKYPLSLVSVA